MRLKSIALATRTALATSHEDAPSATLSFTPACRNLSTRRQDAAGRVSATLAVCKELGISAALCVSATVGVLVVLGAQRTPLAVAMNPPTPTTENQPEVSRSATGIEAKPNQTTASGAAAADSSTPSAARPSVAGPSAARPPAARPATSAAAALAWKTGPEFRTALDSPIGVTWSGTPLRPSLQRLARELRVAMWLDRRLDPGQSIELSVGNEPLDIGCQRIAARLNAGVSRVGAVVYFGPTYTTERLATVAALRRGECERWPASVQARAAVRNARWDDLAEPRALIRATAADAGMEVSNLERAIPHDLWPASELPPLPWADRLSLLLANFDLTFTVDLDQRRIELVPFPDAPRVEKLLTVKGVAAQVATDWADRFPQAEVRVAGGKLAVRARFEDLEIMERVARGERVERARVVAGPSEFTLTVENQPASAILRHIAKQLKLNLEIAPDAVEPLEKLVSVQADRLRLDDLLTAVLRDTGLRFERDEDRIRVRRP